MAAPQTPNGGPPTVGVIIPVHNGRPFITQAINSALNQTLPPQVVVVVDDGSDDGSGELVAEQFGNDPRVVRVRAEGVGPARARHLGLPATKGCQYIALLDADDWWYPAKTAQQLAAFAPGVVAVGSRMHYVGLKGRPFGATRGPLTPALLEWAAAGAYSPCPPSSMIVDGATARTVGFRADILDGRVAQDLVFQRDLLRHGSLVVLDAVLGAYRVHEQTESGRAHGQQMMVARYFRTLAQSGQDESELSFEDFAARYQLDPAAARRERGAVKYRLAGSQLIDGRWLRGTATMAQAAALNPGRTVERLKALAASRLHQGRQHID